MSAFTNLEFHRTGIGLVPEQPGETAHRHLHRPVAGQRERDAVLHLRGSEEEDVRPPQGPLAGGLRGGEGLRGSGLGGGFEAAVWCRLARLLFEGNPQASAKVRVLRVPREPAPAIRVTAPNGDELAEYLDASPARVRFLERTGKAARRRGHLRPRRPARTAGPLPGHRAGAHPPQGRHEDAAPELGGELLAPPRLSLRPRVRRRGTFHPAIDEGSGRFTFTYRPPDGDPGRPLRRAARPGAGGAAAPRGGVPGAGGPGDQAASRWRRSSASPRRPSWTWRCGRSSAPSRRTARKGFSSTATSSSSAMATWSTSRTSACWPSWSARGRSASSRRRSA